MSVSVLVKLCFPGGEKFEMCIGKNTVVGGRALETSIGGGRVLYLGVVAEEDY